jgi:hypothetical protein
MNAPQRVAGTNRWAQASDAVYSDSTANLVLRRAFRTLLAAAVFAASEEALNLKWLR